MDSPWQRLPFTLPAALVLSAGLILGFLRLVSLGATAIPPLPVLDARFIELAAPGPPAAEAAPSSAPEVTPPPPKTKPEPTPRLKPKAAPRPTPRPATAPTPTEPAAGSPSESNADSAASAARSAPSEAHGGGPGGRMSARALYRPLPEIPDQLRRRDVELVAVARFRVAADGTAQVELIEPTSEPSLNQSLMATLRTWRFFPALEEGRPVASTIDLRIPISVR